MRNLIQLTVIVSLVGWSAPSAHSEETGSAVAVKQRANLESGADQARIIRGTEISTGDVISTNKTGQVRVEFTDGTRLLVGPNSKMVVEEYLLSSNNTVRNFSMNALSGTYRFISGRSDSRSYAIHTPSATIGIRGTIFDLSVTNPTIVLHHSGIVEICASSGDCLILDEPCTLAQVNGNGAEGIPPGQTADIMTEDYFGPLVIGQLKAGIFGEWDVPIDKCSAYIQTKSILKNNERFPDPRWEEGNNPAQPPFSPPVRPQRPIDNFDDVIIN